MACNIFMHTLYCYRGKDIANTELRSEAPVVIMLYASVIMYRQKNVMPEDTEIVMGR